MTNQAFSKTLTKNRGEIDKKKELDFQLKEPNFAYRNKLLKEENELYRKKIKELLNEIKGEDKEIERLRIVQDQFYSIHYDFIELKEKIRERIKFHINDECNCVSKTECDDRIKELKEMIKE